MTAYQNSAEINVDTQPPDSPHVMAFTNVRRGMTPATWDATSAPHIAGVWADIGPESGPADLDGNATGDFETGSAVWKQT